MIKYKPSSNPETGAGHTARFRITQESVRVRLLIAIPVLIVLLTSTMGWLCYKIVETEFDSAGRNPSQFVMHNFAQQWLILLIVVDVMGALVGFYLAYSITEPIRAIIKLSKKVAGGDFTDKAAFERSDEMGELGSSFNFMVESLNTFITSRNRFILESFSGGLMTTDETATITTINSAGAKLLGMNPADAAGNKARRVFDRPGTEQFLSLIEETLAKGSPIKLRKVEVKSAHHHVVLNVSTSLMREPSGRVFGMIVNFRDQVELEKFYEQMNRADRLATIGTFATGLAHEIRNPLGAIKGTAQLLAEDVRHNPIALAYTQVIVKEVNRLDALVGEVQEFSQPSASPRRWTNLSRLVHEAIEIAKNNPKALDNGLIKLVENYAELPKTVVSRDKIIQALLNIIINAYQATPPGGRVSATTRFIEEDPLPLRISISNSGSSITPSDMLKIFEPFYTSKDSGTGLGLPIAYQIVTHHGGDIQVQSDDEGVTFVVKLPLVQTDEEITY